MVSKVIKRAKSHPYLSEIYKIFCVIVAGVLVAFGLEAFLIPNGFLDGGITGISIILSSVFSSSFNLNIPVGVFLAVLNLPFVILAWLKIGRRSALRTAIGIATLSISTILLHHIDTLTDNFVLALFFGGSLLGFGVGLALRQGGALDGTETLASIVSDKSKFGVNDLILGINVLIFGVAMFVVGFETAAASAALFFIVVSPMIKKVVDGDAGMRSARVITRYPAEVSKVIEEKLNKRKILCDKRRLFDGQDSFEEEIFELYFNLARLEESEVTDLVLETDPDANVIFTEISAIRGGIYENFSKH